MRLAHALPIALALLAAAGSAAAQETSFSLRYEAGPDCPDREHFSGELVARAPYLRQTADAAHFALEVSIDETAPLTGLLVLREADGQSTTRSVPGASCQEVVSALVLISSLLVDERRAEVSPEPAASPPPPAPPPPPATKVEPARAAPAPVQRRSSFALGTGAGVALELGVSPEAVPAGWFEVAAEWSRPGHLQPLVGVAAERSLTNETVMAAGTARFRWTALRLVGCPLRFPAEGALSLRPCGLFEGGVLEADGVATADAASFQTPWWALGGSGRLDLSLLSSLSAGLEAGIRLQLRDDRYFFGPDSTAFEIPAVGGYGRLALSARW